MPNLDYLYVFLVNNALEIPVYWAFYRFLGRDSAEGSGLPALAAETASGRLAKSAGLVTLSNLCTHSMVFFAFMATGKPYLTALLWAQLFSFLTEAVLHTWAARIPFWRALVASVSANFVSWQFAPLVIYWLFY